MRCITLQITLVTNSTPFIQTDFETTVSQSSCRRVMRYYLILPVLLLLIRVPCAAGDAVDSFNTGFAAHQAEQFDLAISHYRKAIEIGEIDDSRLSYIHHYFGVALSRTGMFEEALASFDRALSLNPELSITFRERGNVHSLRGNFAKAIEDYTQSLRYFPRDAETYHNRGFAWYGLRKLQKAVEDYDQALRLRPQVLISLYNRCLAYYGLGKFNLAMDDCSAIIEADAGEHGALNTRGNTYFQLHDYASAIEDYTAAILLQPDNAIYYLNRGSSYIAQDNESIGRLDLEKGLSLDPTNPEIRQRHAQAMNMAPDLADDGILSSTSVSPDTNLARLPVSQLLSIEFESFRKTICCASSATVRNPEHTTLPTSAPELTSPPRQHDR